MNAKIKQQRLTLCRRPANSEAPSNPAGLNRTHRMIRSSISNETQFLLLCSRIRLNEYKQARSESQRDERKAKR
jgi:hypothetical protein